MLNKGYGVLTDLASSTKYFNLTCLFHESPPSRRPRPDRDLAGAAIAMGRPRSSQAEAGVLPGRIARHFAAIHAVDMVMKTLSYEAHGL